MKTYLNFLTKGIATIVICTLPIASFSQIFYDGFESGFYSPTWIDGLAPFTRTVTSTAPAVGTNCFELTGGINNHYEGIIGNFNPTIATSVSWRAKTSTNLHTGYVVIGDANTTGNQGMVFSRFTDVNTLRFYDGSVSFDYPVSLNTWYEVTLSDIDWVNKEFDIYINGILEYADFPFRAPATTNLSQIHFYNFHNGTAYLDEVSVFGVLLCTTPPTAICQNVDVYLDATGNASISDSDLDGGSIDNCSTTGLTFSASQTSFTCADVASSPTPEQSLVLSGVIDGPLPLGTPKAVEFYVVEDIPDLSLYGFGSANNGNGTDGVEFTFPAVSATAGQFIYLATESAEFTNWFGFAPDYTHATATSVNGDDALELFYNSNVIDVFGDINMSGTGQAWEYIDGWAYRNNNTGPDGTTFNASNWSYSGINVLDGEFSNASAATPFPTGTYTSSGSGGVAVTLTVTDGNGNSSNCIANVSVYDTILPSATTPSNISVDCIGDVPVADPLLVNDEADNCGIPTVTWTSDVSDGLSCPETITRTYNVLDDHGNSIDLIQTIIVYDLISPSASAPLPINVECLADVPAPDVLLITDEVDNCTATPIVTWVGDVSDGLSCPETITRTYSVTDDCGNAITVDQIITVQDITAPVPDGGLLAVNSNCDVTLSSPTATDNCDGAIAAVADVTFPITDMGTTTVTWTYVDVCGNVSTQTQDVTIAPVDVSTSILDWTITANNSGQTYQWIDCSDDSQIVGEIAQSYTATANGVYAVIVTTIDGCIDTSACVSISGIGIGELQMQRVQLYPNPSETGEFYINYEGAINSVAVFDMLGREIIVPVNLNSMIVQANKLSSGTYLIQLTTDKGEVLQGTILIQK